LLSFNVVSMKLTYLYNSGFMIECERFMVVLDFCRDSPELSVQQALASFQGKIYVLVSHWHPDHFNRTVLHWRQIHPEINYIFSDDIRENMHWMTFKGVSFLKKREVREDELLRIKAFGSTDVGGSFLLDIEGKRIFHAGDLNNWHWNEEASLQEIQAAERDFFQEVDLLATTASQLDVVMFPVDPRLGKDYMLGAQQFVGRIPTKIFVPMHFGDDFSKAQAFRPFAEAAGCRFIGWQHSGECVDL